MSSAAPTDLPTVQLRLLGTVAATVDGHAIPLGGPRVRALLVALARAKGRTLSAETLLHEVWGEATPGVRSALRANISRLRGTPLGSHLLGGREGYALVADRGLEVDLWRIDELPASGASIEELVALVDAVPFDGAAESPFLTSARAAARAQVRHAATRAIDAAPHHPHALTLAERLLAFEPGRPELRALVISARLGGTPTSRHQWAPRDPAARA